MLMSTTFLVPLPSVLGGVQLIGEVQRVAYEGGSTLVQLLSHAGWSHGV